ncbi:hypothetical protein BD324DRAFT_684333 [Kockovaella imperatae]|uniref:Uncharacterized protein n=1 Tax=Kockovaella imperatae TaxID=4999 RepID=A0A1Y1U721_9TREE|nr:hypothetical protein BD324DRAFT_684333 [Kockovaella imperatae]ORX33334.1 hypothetical protein BD324DRAFT_684333 [Kockovaella imperatae]
MDSSLDTTLNRSWVHVAYDDESLLETDAGPNREPTPSISPLAYAPVNKPLPSLPSETRQDAAIGASDRAPITSDSVDGFDASAILPVMVSGIEDTPLPMHELPTFIRPSSTTSLMTPSGPITPPRRTHITHDANSTPDTAPRLIVDFTSTPLGASIKRELDARGLGQNTADNDIQRRSAALRPYLLGRAGAQIRPASLSGAPRRFKPIVRYIRNVRVMSSPAILGTIEGQGDQNRSANIGTEYTSQATHGDSDIAEEHRNTTESRIAPRNGLLAPSAPSSEDATSHSVIGGELTVERPSTPEVGPSIVITYPTPGPEPECDVELAVEPRPAHNRRRRRVTPNWLVDTELSGAARNPLG